MKRWLVLLLAALAMIAVALVVGPAPISLPNALRGLIGRADPTTVSIVRELRAPRALLAFLVGGSLAVTGATLQALVRNPLADPYLLGLSGGAGLGAVVAIALHVGGVWGVPALAFIGALVAVALVYRLALVAGSVLDTRILLLAGVVVGAFGGALIGAIITLSPAPELRNALLWLLGGFDSASWQSLGVFAAYAAVPWFLLFRANRALDLLALGEEPARFLGVEVEAFKRLLYIAASLLTAAAVAVSGMIGFVGLIVPHATRMIWGQTHRTMLPAAFLLGGILLVAADAVARTIVAPVTLPVGVVTALVGVPVFALLLRRWTT